MRFWLSFVALFSLTNCDVFSDNKAFNNSSPSLSQQASKLKIETVEKLLARPGQALVDLAGNCNEGGFTSNQVSWEILQGGNSLRKCTPGSNCGVCQRGRFQMAVDFSGFGPQNDMSVRVELTASDPGLPVQFNPLSALKMLQVQVF